jgi:hypothetical protein
MWEVCPYGIVRGHDGTCAGSDTLREGPEVELVQRTVIYEFPVS